MENAVKLTQEDYTAKNGKIYENYVISKTIKKPDGTSFEPKVKLTYEELKYLWNEIGYFLSGYDDGTHQPH